MRRYPVSLGIVGADLQVNQIVFAAVVLSHRCEGFPIDPFFINAQSAPGRLMLEDLMSELIDAGTGLARAGVAGDEPAATKLMALPGEPAKPGRITLSVDEQEPKSDDHEHNSAHQKTMPVNV